MNRKLQGYLICADYYGFGDEKTGEYVELTKIKYTTKCEDSDSHVGDSILECSYKGNIVNKFKGLCGKNVVLEIKEQNLKNGVKFIVSKVNEVNILD